MINNSFNINDFDSSVRTTINQYNALISKFPQISEIYNELASLTGAEDNRISSQLRQLANTTRTLNDKCKDIGSRMEDWLNRYKSTMSQSEEDLKTKIARISENLARYNQELNSMHI